MNTDVQGNRRETRLLGILNFVNTTVWRSLFGKVRFILVNKHKMGDTSVYFGYQGWFGMFINVVIKLLTKIHLVIANEYHFASYGEPNDADMFTRTVCHIRDERPLFLYSI